MSLTPGFRLGPYEILSPLGAGGMGEVYRARDTRLLRQVAIKVLPEALHGDADALSRFEREARAMAALSHPNILAIHDFGEEEGIAYSVTELLEGETLVRRSLDGPLPAGRCPEFGAAVAAALSAAHYRGIVHRDVKPDNLFLTNSRRVKVLDFGLVRQVDPGRSEPPTRPPRRPWNDARDGAGYRRLHVARAGPGRAGGCPLRHLLARLRALRDADRPGARSKARRRRKSSCRFSETNPPRCEGPPEDPPEAVAGSPPLSRKESRAAVSDGARPCLRPSGDPLRGGAAGRAGDGARGRHGLDRRSAL